MAFVRADCCTVSCNRMNFHLLKLSAKFFPKDRLNPTFCKVILDKNGELFINPT